MWGIITITSASNSSYKEVEFSNGTTAQLKIKDAGTDRRELITEVDNGSTSNLKCTIMTPNSELRSLSSCNGEFNYDGEDIGRIKIWIRYYVSWQWDLIPRDREGKPDNTSIWTYPQWVYDRNNEERSNDDLDNNNDNHNNEVTELTMTNIYPNDPDKNEDIDITVEAWNNNKDTIDEYRWTVRFTVEVRDDSDNERDNASTSDYEIHTTSYTFNSSDDGEHKFNNIITFLDDNEDYRVVVYDKDENTINKWYKIFDFGNGYNDNNTNDNTDNFSLTTDDSSPDKNQYIDLTITTKDGSTIDTSYRGKVTFEIRYKESGHSTWYKTTSLSDYEMKYPYENNGYTFSSSNAGRVTITDFIKFRKENYQYKIIVVDNDNNNIDGEKIFTLENDDNNNSEYNFNLTTDDSTPSTNQWIDLTVKARNNISSYTSYRGTLQFEIYYKASASSTWTKTTSSTYYEIANNYDDNGYTFTSSNAGQKTFTNLIRFKTNNYSYKVLVYDEDEEMDFQWEKIFTVGNTSNDSDIDWFTTNELNTVESVYDARNNMISNLKSIYPRLRTHTTRQTKSDNLYNEMKKILDDSSNKEYDDFDAFSDAWSERYRYTISVR